MRRSFVLVALFTWIPALAAAQLEMAGEAPAPAPSAPAPAPSAPVVLSVPAPSAPTPSASAPSAPAPSRPLEASETPPSDNIRGYVGVSLVLDAMNLAGRELAFGNPEVSALRGLRLGGDWLGSQRFQSEVVGGLALAFGIRPHELIRGPELRFSLAGGDINGPWASAPGAPEGFELSVRSALVARFEAAVGLQLPLGPVVPYALIRGSMGAAFLDVEVRDARLGSLGTETLETGVFELGLEAGVALRMGEGVELGVAFRGSFIGTESLGGALTLGFEE